MDLMWIAEYRSLRLNERHYGTRKKEVKNETLKARRFYNRTAREQDNSL